MRRYRRPAPAPPRFTGRDVQLMARTLTDIDRQQRTLGLPPIDRSTSWVPARMVELTALRGVDLRPVERAQVADLIAEHVGARTGPAVW